jgi:hypothetical protein
VAIADGVGQGFVSTILLTKINLFLNELLFSALPATVVGYTS